jgi:carboxylate-amine ligase
MIKEPSFTIGIEEEYLLVDKQTRDLVAAPKKLMSACTEKLKDQVSPEFLRCQIEVGTRVCETAEEARADLAHLRSTVADLSGEFGLMPLAASCHPFANWQDQHFTKKDRYAILARDLADVARRMLICGMHVHVGIEDDELRIDLMNQMGYFLPHLLALSTSSPFWQGKDTGLNSYRLTVFDNLPRTGLPPRFSSHSEYQRSIEILKHADIIEDATKIWWDIRPSDRFPTLESRICDVAPLLDDAISLAMLTRCILRMLYRLRRENKRWRIYERFLVGENRWRAQRYGFSEGLIDFGLGEITDYNTLLDEIFELVGPDIEYFGCRESMDNAVSILKRGTSADRQRATYKETLEKGGDEQTALFAVVDMVAAETVEGTESA